jgi:hypothetical protein
MATRTARGKFEQICNLAGRRKTLRDLRDAGPSTCRFCRSVVRPDLT